MLNRKLLPVLFAFLIPCFLPAQVTPDEVRVNKVFNSLTLEEKANLCQGDLLVQNYLRKVSTNRNMFTCAN